MILKTVVAIGLFSLCSSLAVAQTAPTQSNVEKWGAAGTWQILVDPGVGNGCYMEKVLPDDTLVQVGFVPDRKGGFFSAHNPTWNSIQEGVIGTVQFDFGKSLFGGNYVGVVSENFFGGYAFFNNPDFVSELGKRNSLTIMGDKGSTLNVSLTGTSRAINAVRKCQAEQAAE